MSSARRHANPGKRERQARKRHRRGSVWFGGWAAGAPPLKVGLKHARRVWRKTSWLCPMPKGRGGAGVMGVPAEPLPE